MIPEDTTLELIYAESQYGSCIVLLSNAGTITNYGTVVVSNYCLYSYGIFNSGIIDNYGTMIISNSGETTGILNEVTTFNNYGTMVIPNSDFSTGIANYNTINNSGLIQVSNTEGNGILSGIINNDGRIEVNSDYTFKWLNGIDITVSNTGATGIDVGFIFGNEPILILYCGEGTTLNQDSNQCEADSVSEVTCGEGTTLNETTNQCEADVTQDDLDYLQSLLDEANAIIEELQSSLPWGNGNPNAGSIGKGKP